VPPAQAGSPTLTPPGADRPAPTIIYKFGGSSVADAARMREVAAIVCGASPADLPAVVLSAMGKV
jgi:aspartate kinase